MTSQPSRRTQQRYDVRLPVKITSADKTYTAETRNMSVGGMFIETDAPLTFNMVVRLSFDVPHHREPIEVDAHVRWLEGKTGSITGAGVQFQGLRAVYVWALNKFFQDKTPSG